MTHNHKDGRWSALARMMPVMLLAFVLLLASCTGVLAQPQGEDQPDQPAGLEDIPPYEGALFIQVNGGQPFFDEDDYAHESGWEEYSPLDGLGREGTAMIVTSYADMEFSERPSISQYHPSGWVQNRYDTSIVEAGWLYNRSHICGRQLGGADRRENLMTGTRLFNAGSGGMLTFENMVADHMKEYKDHVVVYRATPDFHDDGLLAHGILIESDCTGCDDTADFCVYIYNVQPGIAIDYETGDNRLAGQDGQDDEDPSMLPDATDYVLNSSSGTFHLPSCRHAGSMSVDNRKDIHAPRYWMLDLGYVPCGVCNP